MQGKEEEKTWGLKTSTKSQQVLVLTFSLKDTILFSMLAVSKQRELFEAICYGYLS